MSWPLTAVSRARRDGFLLVEVLVAVAVAGVLIAALLRGFSDNWIGIRLVREEADAMIVARAVLEAAGPRASLAPGVQEGISGRYGWMVAISELPVEPAPVPTPPGAGDTAAVRQASAKAAEARAKAPKWMLYRVNITVNRPSGRRTVLETYRLGRAPTTR